MDFVNDLSLSKWLHRKEVLATKLVEWIPFSILKMSLYRTIFARLGTSAQIHRGVQLLRPHGIEIGNRTTLESGVILKNVGKTSKIWIGDSVTLESGVRLKSSAHNSRIRIGDGTLIERGVDIKVHSMGTIEIGANTHIGPYTCLSGRAISIGKNCLIASHNGIYAGNHNFSDCTRPIRGQGIIYKEKGIAIEDDCWLASGVRVVDGVTIGRGSVIGAGAVVTQDIPPYSVAVGVPAKVISQRHNADNKL
ncbi:transferase [cyanobacterium TDX16]|nr:transferase [cyanobacterium TDX16]